jgi:hypothetical protein
MSGFAANTPEVVGLLSIGTCSSHCSPSHVTPAYLLFPDCAMRYVAVVTISLPMHFLFMHCSHRHCCCHHCCRLRRYFHSLLPLPCFLCAVVLSALVVSSFAIFVFSASPLLPFVAFPMSFVPCRLRVCLPPPSPFGPSCSEPRKKNSFVPGPAVPVAVAPPPPPLLNLPPSGEGAAY